MNNIIGQKFNRLTVLEKTLNKRGTSYLYNCICDCGNYTMATSTELKSGHKKSCGCLHTEQRHNLGCSKKVNLIGQTFGELKVLEECLERKYERVQWKCQCSCGKILIVTSKDLIENRKTHCGCKYVGSKGEEKIKNILLENNISFQTEYIFNDFISPEGRHYRFDFYLPEYNCLIEYDGKQHYIYDKGYGSDIKNIQHRDSIKNQYCIENNLLLIRIPYTHYNDLKIADLLPNTSQFLINNKGG